MPAVAEPHAKDPRTSRPPKPKVARVCGWDWKPFDCNGVVVGFFHVTEGKKRDHYRMVRQHADDMSVTLEVTKRQPGGEFAEPYYVAVPAPGASGASSCTCLGHHYTGKCRHASALRTLWAKLQEAQR
jgi:hypothetical protein